MALTIFLSRDSSFRDLTFRYLGLFIKINLSRIDEESTDFALKALEVMLQANNENFNSVVIGGLPVYANYIKVIH